MAQAKITVNGVAGSNDDVPINAAVTLGNQNTGGEIQYAWTLLEQPPGAADALSAGSGSPITLTPRKEGTYRVQLIVNPGASQLTDIQIIAVRDLKTRDRVPAPGEETDTGANGWAEPDVNTLLRHELQHRADPRVQSGLNNSGAPFNHGDVVYVSGVTTIKTGLPGAEKVATYGKALATDATKVSWLLAIVENDLDGNNAIADGKFGRLRVGGLFTGVAYGGADPAVNDPVYVSDAAAPALAAGTNSRVIGHVASVDAGASTFDFWFEGAPSGQATHSDTATFATTAGGAPPTGAAGGILGYPGSTYPNPTGLAPIGTSLPIYPGVGASLTWQEDNKAVGGGAGIPWNIRASNGGGANAGNAAGAGADLKLFAGNGGAGDATHAAAAGGAMNITAGAGGAASGANASGTGGTLTFQGGAGGTGSGNAAGAPGAGGAVTFSGGTGAQNDGTTHGGRGGNVSLEGGAGGSGGGTGATVLVIGGLGGAGDSGAGFNGGNGGVSIVQGGSGGDGDPGTTAGNGAQVQLVGGSAGADNGGGGGTGGSVLIQGGASSGAGKAGAAVTMQGSAGTAGSAAVAGGVGGVVNIAGGNGGDGSAAHVAGAGASVQILGGSAGANNGGGGANGGDAIVDSGVASGAGTNGAVNVGPTRASAVNLGRDGVPTTTVGPDVGTVQTLDLGGAPVSPIPVTSPVLKLVNQAAGVITDAQTPSVQTSGIPEGTEYEMICTTALGFIFQSETNLVGSKLKLGAATRQIDQYGVLKLRFADGFWIETYFRQTSF